MRLNKTAQIDADLAFLAEQGKGASTAACVEAAIGAYISRWLEEARSGAGERSAALRGAWETHATFSLDAVFALLDEQIARAETAERHAKALAASMLWDHRPDADSDCGGCQNLAAFAADFPDERMEL